MRQFELLCDCFNFKDKWKAENDFRSLVLTTKCAHSSNLIGIRALLPEKSRTWLRKTQLSRDYCRMFPETWRLAWKFRKFAMWIFHAMVTGERNRTFVPNDAYPRVLEDGPPHRELSALLLPNSGVGSFTSLQCKVEWRVERWGLRFNVLIREDGNT